MIEPSESPKVGRSIIFFIRLGVLSPSAQCLAPGVPVVLRGSCGHVVLAVPVAPVVHFTIQGPREQHFTMQDAQATIFYYARVPGNNILLCKGSQQRNFIMQGAQTTIFYYAGGPDSNIVLLCNGPQQQHFIMQGGSGNNILLCKGSKQQHFGIMCPGSNILQRFRGRSAP